MPVIVSCQPLDRTFDTVSTYSACKINRSANVYLFKEQTSRHPQQKLVDVFSVYTHTHTHTNRVFNLKVDVF
jgi:hypothetical protein